MRIEKVSPVYPSGDATKKQKEEQKRRKFQEELKKKAKEGRKENVDTVTISDEARRLYEAEKSKGLDR